MGLLGEINKTREIILRYYDLLKISISFIVGKINQ